MTGNEYPAALALGQTMLDTATPGNLPDVLRSLAMSDGTTAKFSAVLNQLIADVNSLKALGGGPVAASQTVVIGGTFHAGDIVNITVGGHEVSYTSVAGDTNLAGVASSTEAALNADATFSASYVASVNSGTITITAKVAGTAANAVTLTASVSGSGATTTATAGGAYLAGGVGPIQQPSVAAGTSGQV